MMLITLICTQFDIQITIIKLLNTINSIDWLWFWTFTFINVVYGNLINMYTPVDIEFPVTTFHWLISKYAFKMIDIFCVLFNKILSIYFSQREIWIKAKRVYFRIIKKGTSSLIFFLSRKYFIFTFIATQSFVNYLNKY